MSPPKTQHTPTKVRGLLRGLGEVAEFLREVTVAGCEVLIGKWPRPLGQRSRQLKTPSQEIGPVEQIAPFPIDD